MSIALYPGTFDPITFGHIDIAMRASRIFSRVVAVVAQNPGKNPLFSIDERLDMVTSSLLHVPSIEVISYGGLIVNCVKEYKASVIIRGLRALTDFESEFQMAYTNRKLYDAAETVFLMPSARYTYLNSTMVKQIIRLGGDITQFVPEYVHRKLLLKVGGGGVAAASGAEG
ncbi:MAG: pantetheine-phosphate adenylyltransferase [Chitinispirillaceae bacterium]|nr:pantetheine-phosphate adenylyltransferase [Chitinispirillaceae bacterium]